MSFEGRKMFCGLATQIMETCKLDLPFAVEPLNLPHSPRAFYLPAIWKRNIFIFTKCSTKNARLKMPC